MEELTPIEEIREMVAKEEKVPTNIEQEDFKGIADDIIQNEYNKDKQQLQENEDFQKVANEIVVKSAEVQMQNDLIKLLSQKQKNDLAQYYLDCEKEKLNFRKSKEKKVILQEVKAEVANKKMETLWKRYGYLYKEKKDFVASKSANVLREIANWWKGTSDNFKKVVKGTIKIILWTGAISLIVLLGYRGFMWLAENTKNLPNLK
jgi:hypothetical protein